MKRTCLLLPLGLSLAIAASGAQANTIGPDNAQGYIGRDATVCGSVASARYNENADGQPTFMHFGGAFPRHQFAVRIDGANRSHFSPEPEQLVGKMVCVAGRIGRAAGNRPEMVITAPAALQLL